MPVAKAPIVAGNRVQGFPIVTLEPVGVWPGASRGHNVLTAKDATRRRTTARRVRRVVGC